MLGNPQRVIRQPGVEDEHAETVNAMQEVKCRGDQAGHAAPGLGAIIAELSWPVSAVAGRCHANIIDICFLPRNICRLPWRINQVSTIGYSWIFGFIDGHAGSPEL